MTHIKNLILLLFISFFVFNNLPAFSMGENEEDAVWIGHSNFIKNEYDGYDDEFQDIKMRRIDVVFGSTQPQNYEPEEGQGLLTFGRINRDHARSEIHSRVTATFPKTDLVELHFNNVNTGDHLQLISSTLYACLYPFSSMSKLPLHGLPGGVRVNFRNDVSEELEQIWSNIEQGIEANADKMEELNRQEKN